MQLELNSKTLGVCLFVIGLLLFVSPWVMQPLTLLSSGENLDQWSAGYGSVSLDNSLYYSAPSSIRWSTNLTGSTYNSYAALYVADYGQWKDWSATPLLRFQIYPHFIPVDAVFNIEIIDGPWIEYAYPTFMLTANEWNNVTVDLSSQPSALTAVWIVRFHFEFSFSGNDFDIANIDDVEILSSGPSYSLTVQSASGGTFNPPPGTHLYAQGSTVTVTAIPNVGYVLQNFILDGTNVGKPSTDAYTITMDKDHTITATFTQSQLQTGTVLLTSSIGGHTQPPSGTWEYTVGATATLQAVPGSGYKFSHWIVDGQTITTNPYSFTIQQQTYNIQAVFAESGGFQFPKLAIIQWIGIGVMCSAGVVAVPKKKKEGE